MLQRFAVWVVCIGLAGACEAVCQSQRPVESVAPGTQVTTPHAAATHTGAVERLPDAPSASVANRSDFLAENLLDRQWAHNSTATGQALQPVPSAPPLALVTGYETDNSQKGSSDFLSKFLVASMRNQNSRYRTSSNDHWIGRATDAASSIFVTRDESGKRRLNTSYFVTVLTSVAAHSASRPYWARSASEPLGDFGSTVGNDAGMNLLHEFGPGLREAVTGHMPSFVFKIEQRVAGERNSLQARANPAR